LHWSGSFDALLLAIVIDTTSNRDTATSVLQPRTIPVDVFPVGDCFELINSITVTEDLGPATVGSVLAAGITLVDDGIITENNNNSTETIIRNQLVGLELGGIYAPAQIEGESRDGFGSTYVTYGTINSGTPVCTIASKTSETICRQKLSYKYSL
jgi:hypothetical protein